MKSARSVCLSRMMLHEVSQPDYFRNISGRGRTRTRKKTMEQIYNIHRHWDKCRPLLMITLVNLPEKSYKLGSLVQYMDVIKGNFF
jgi:hypothetical protein